MSKGEKIALFAGNTGIVITTLIGVAYIGGAIPIITGGHVWSILSLVLYFVFVATAGIALRRVIKRRPIKTLWGMKEYNVFGAISAIVLWVPIFIVWLIITAEISGSTVQQLMGVAFYLLPVTAIGIAFFCHIIDELFNQKT
jgi:hypothetical protein